MAISSNLLESAGNLLIEYLQTDDNRFLIENLTKLIKENKENELLNNLKSILLELNNWNIKTVQENLEQMSSKIEDDKFKNILTIFKGQLCLLLIDRIIEKSEDISLKIQAYLNKVPLLDEIFQISKKLNDKIIINKYLERHIDNFIILGLLTLHSEKYESSIKFFAKALEFLRGNEKFYPKQHSFLLRILSLLFLKIRTLPNLFETSKTILNIDRSQQDHFQIAFKFIKQAISTDEKANYSPGLALDYYYLALIFYHRNMIEQGITEVKKAQALHEQLGARENILNDLILLGMLTSKTDKNEEALKLYNQALNIANDLGLKNKIADLNLLISSFLYTQRNYEESLKHLKTALVIYKQDQIGSPFDLIESYTQIGITLREMAKIDEANKFLLKILEVEKKSKSSLVLMHIYSQLAITHIHLDNEEEFNKNYQEVLALFEKNKDELQYANIEYQIGVGFCNKRKLQEGLKHLGKAFVIYYTYQLNEMIEHVLQTFSLIYQDQKNSELADAIADKSVDITERSKILFEKGQIPDLKLPEIQVLPKIPKQEKIEASKESPPSPKLLKVRPPPHPDIPPMKTPPKSTTEVSPEKPKHPAPPSSKPPLPIAIPITDNDIESKPEKITAPPSPKIELKQDIQPTMEIVEKKPSIPTPPPKPPIQPSTHPKRKCPKCGFVITNPEFAFCPKCATKLDTVRVCRKCGFTIEDPSFKFCPKCATPL